MKNPYYKEDTSKNMAAVIHDYLCNDKMKIEKEFYDVKFLNG